MRNSRRGAGLACALVGLAAAVPAHAAEPPNGNDPCSRAGRDVCGTTGIGSYRQYRYGVRWFGDYRGAVPGQPHTFCIDLRFWYPSADHRYREQSGTLRNRTGEAIDANRQAQMAYAIWNYGRSDDPVRQAAVMLYVHALMSDARPGEVDPAALGAGVRQRYAAIAAETARLRGPYRIESEVKSDGSPLRVGVPATLTLRVLAASGAAVPGVHVTLAGGAPNGLPAAVDTDAQGVARVAFTPARAGALGLAVRAEELASPRPRVFAASTAQAAPNAQRLVVPASTPVSRDVQGTVAPDRVSATISTEATPASLILGQQSRDRVTLGGVPATWRGTVAVRVYGPFASALAIRCDGPPAFTTTYAPKGPATFLTPPALLSQPGWYVYQETVPSNERVKGLTTPCNDAAERFVVQVQPHVITAISSTTTTPGTPISDKVTVAGLAGQTVTVGAALFGPFPSAAAIRCDGPPAWTGSFQAATDGDYQTEAFTVTTPGYYTYRETIAATELVRAVETPCADTSETTVVQAAPKLTTRVSAQRAAPGASITDTVQVSGLGTLEATVKADLWGPFPTPGAIRCTGKPAWSGTLDVRGDGRYTTPAVRLDEAGYYTYHESMAATPAFAAVTTACGETAETTLVRGAPRVTTVASAEVVRAGDTLTDEVRVEGLGRTQATVDVELFGPFATREAVACSGRPHATEQLRVPGDGTYRTRAVSLDAAGFYTYRERIAGTALAGAVETPCGLVPETALAAPQIVTGRGDVARTVLARAAAVDAPTRISVPSQGIEAPITPVGIDVRNGVLGVPADIGRAGWWRDGMAPGARTGAILVAGHVDSARRGAGAFFRLPHEHAGQVVELTTASGRRFRYRVVSVKVMAKAKLPLDVYSRRGAARLVLVTCGGPFDQAQGHYRDNVVVTAVPL